MDDYRGAGVPRDDAALVFHLSGLLLPLLYGIYGGWRERTHVFGDLLARHVLLTVVGWRPCWGGLAGGAGSCPERIYWPLLHGAWMSLAPVSYPLFCLTAATLLDVYLRQPRPQHAAQVLGLLALWWMLPKVSCLPMSWMS